MIILHPQISKMMGVLSTWDVRNSDGYAEFVTVALRVQVWYGCGQRWQGD